MKVKHILEELGYWQVLPESLQSKILQDAVISDYFGSIVSLLHSLNYLQINSPQGLSAMALSAFMQDSAQATDALNTSSMTELNQCLSPKMDGSLAQVDIIEFVKWLAVLDQSEGVRYSISHCLELLFYTKALVGSLGLSKIRVIFQFYHDLGLAMQQQNLAIDYCKSLNEVLFTLASTASNASILSGLSEQHFTVLVHHSTVLQPLIQFLFKTNSLLDSEQALFRVNYLLKNYRYTQEIYAGMVVAFEGGLLFDLSNSAHYTSKRKEDSQYFVNMLIFAGKHAFDLALELQSLKRAELLEDSSKAKTRKDVLFMHVSLCKTITDNLLLMNQYDLLDGELGDLREKKLHSLVKHSAYLHAAFERMSVLNRFDAHQVDLFLDSVSALADLLDQWHDSKYINYDTPKLKFFVDESGAVSEAVGDDMISRLNESRETFRSTAYNDMIAILLDHVFQMDTVLAGVDLLREHDLLSNLDNMKKLFNQKVCSGAVIGKADYLAQGGVLSQQQFDSLFWVGAQLASSAQLSEVSGFSLDGSSREADDDVAAPLESKEAVIANPVQADDVTEEPFVVNVLSSPVEDDGLPIFNFKSLSLTVPFDSFAVESKMEPSAKRVLVKPTPAPNKSYSVFFQGSRSSRPESVFPVNMPVSKNLKRSRRYLGNEADSNELDAADHKRTRVKSEEKTIFSVLRQS